MAYFQVGDYIGRLRKQRGISQEKLAEGIMSRSTLSRIEGGKHVPEKAAVDAILQRLGQVTSPYHTFLMSDEEVDAYRLRDQLNEHIILRDTAAADAMIINLGKHPAFQDGLHKQFLLANKALNLLYKGGKLQAVREMLDDAICMTIPNFNELLIDKYILRHEEIEIVSVMATVYDKSGKRSHAIKLLKRLIQSITSGHEDEKEKTNSLSPVFINLTNYLGQSGEYEEALRICDKAISMCIGTNVFGYLPQLAFNKACALHFLGNKKECKRLLYQAYYSAQLMGMDYLLPIYEKYGNELFGLKNEWL